MNINNVFGILLYLLNHKKANAQILAEKLEISTRTVYRYLDTLSLWGVPVVCLTGRNGGIYIEKNFCLKNIFFTQEEFETLLTLTKNNKILFEKIMFLKLHNYA